MQMPGLQIIEELMIAHEQIFDNYITKHSCPILIGFVGIIGTLYPSLPKTPILVTSKQKQVDYKTFP